MAQRNIRQIGDEILRKKSREVEELTPHVKELIEDMKETMMAKEGCGLAAVQVGVLRRIVVIDTREEGEQFVFINPVITSSSGEETGPEACLSVAERQGYVKRPTHLALEAKDEEFKNITLKAEGFLARVICHELDHLDGVLYTDKVVPNPKEDLEEDE